MCLHKELNLESLSRKLGLVSAFGEDDNVEACEVAALKKKCG